MRNIAACKPKVTLDDKQFNSLPSKAFIRKYKDGFVPGSELELANIRELEILKFSGDENVREQFYKVYCTVAS